MLLYVPAPDAGMFGVGVGAGSVACGSETIRPAKRSARMCVMFQARKDQLSLC